MNSPELRVVDDPRVRSLRWRMNGLQLEVSYQGFQWVPYPPHEMQGTWQPAERRALWRDLFLNPATDA